MSHCVLRSVSPIHLEYLRNMGVGATLSVSLLKNGALWGLIACHHYQPKRVCPERRLTCSFLGQIIESQLNMREEGDERAYRLQTSAIQVRFLDLVARASSLNGLARGPDERPGLRRCSGGGDRPGHEVHSARANSRRGGDPRIDRLDDGLSRPRGFMPRTRFPLSYPPGEKFKDVASGMLGVEISRRAWRLSPLVPARTGSHGQLGRQSRQTGDASRMGQPAYTRASRSSFGRRR